MRDLTAKQKMLLKKWFKQKEPSANARMLLGSVNPMRTIDDLSYEQFKILEEINDTEVLYQNVNRFIMDLRMGDIKI